MKLLDPVHTVEYFQPGVRACFFFATLAAAAAATFFARSIPRYRNLGLPFLVGPN